MIYLKFFEVLREKVWLQSVLFLLPFTLISIYICLLVTDISNAYTIAYKNAEVVKSDDTSFKVKDYKVDDDWYVITKEDDTEVQVQSPRMSTMLGTGGELYYSEAGNMLMSCVDREYYGTLLMESNIVPVCFSWVVVMLLIVFCYVRREFVVLGKNVCLILFGLEGIILATIILGGLLVF